MTGCRQKLLVLMAVLMVTGLAVTTIALAASPKAFLPKTSYEFDPVPEGVEIIHEFLVENKGDAELKIEKVKTG